MRYYSTTYNISIVSPKKEGCRVLIHPLILYSVGYTIELSNKFIVDFEKIIQFLGKYSNIQTETILKGK